MVCNTANLLEMLLTRDVVLTPEGVSDAWHLLTPHLLRPAVAPPEAARGTAPAHRRPADRSRLRTKKRGHRWVASSSGRRLRRHGDGRHSAAAGRRARGTTRRYSRRHAVQLPERFGARQPFGRTADEDPARLLIPRHPTRAGVCPAKSVMKSHQPGRTSTLTTMCRGGRRASGMVR